MEQRIIPDLPTPSRIRAYDQSVNSRPL
ncbi:hypothetical protein NC651_013509 [Populus alba x Populus x berolinensis]|nr:hypothetical protein NC651_013509 [Populus alba x Populus x berolinensis]